MSTESGNPNVAVGAEAGALTSKTNSITTFNDIDESDVPPPDAKPAKKDDKKPSGKVAEKKDEPKGGAKGKAPADFEEEDGDESEEAGKSDKKPADKKDEPEPKADKPQTNAKPKSHKGRTPDGQSLSLSSDTLFPVEVNGKKEDVPFQELVNNWSGKQNYDRKFNDLAKERKSHEQSVKTLDSHVKRLYETSQKDHEEAFDVLADIAGKDPIELKEGILRSQFKSVIDALAERGVKIPGVENVIEDLVNESKLTWRERKLTRAEKGQQAEKKQTEAQQALSRTKDTYGIDDESFDAAREMVQRFYQEKGIDEEVKPEAVVFAHRHQLVVETIREVVPHLANRDDISQIVQDTTEDLVKNPKRTKEQLRATLMEVFGGNDEDAERQRRLSRKAQERKDQVPRSAESARGSKPLMSFDEIGDD